MGSTSRHVKLSIVNKEGEAKPEYKIEGRGIFVEAINEQEYGIQVENTTGVNLGAKIMVDGHQVACRVLAANRSVIVKEVISKVINVGGVEKDVYSPLVFAQPDIVEEGTTLDKTAALNRPVAHATVAGGAADKLGLIEVQVTEIHRGPPRPCGRSVLSREALSVAVTEKEGTKKGAFRSTTAIGSTERVEARGHQMSEWSLGNDIEKVQLRYGSRAMLLLLGVNPAYFMVRQSEHADQEVDLTGDDDDDGANVAAAVVPKREREAGGGGGAAAAQGGGGGATTGDSPRRTAAPAKRFKIEPGAFLDLT